MGGLNTLTRISGFRKGLGAQESIFSDPFLVAWWKADKSVNNRLLKDMSRHGHHMYFGSAKAAAVVDGGLALPGIANSYASTPNQAALQITGDLDIRVLMRLDPGALNTINQAVVSRRNGTVAEFELRWGGGVGFLQLYWAEAGTFVSPTGSAAVPNISTQFMWVRAVRENNVGGVWRVTYYYSADGVNWTQLNQFVGSAPANPTAGGAANPLQIGANNVGTSQPFQGVIAYVEVRSGVGGPVVAMFDARDKADGITFWTGAPNLLAKDSSDLEGGIGEWSTIGGNATVTRSTAVAKSGTASMSLVSLAPGAMNTTSLFVPIAVGQSVTALVSVRAATVARTAVIYPQFYDAGGSFISNGANVPGAAITTGWTDISGTWVAPAGTVSTRLILQVGATAAAGEQFFFDEVGFYYGAVVPVWSPGEVPWRVNFPAVTTNDPQSLPYDVANGIGAYVPGVNGNNVSSPYQAALAVTGDIDVRVKLARDNWTDATGGKMFFSRYNFTSNLRSWRLGTDLAGGTSGKLTFSVSPDGVGANNFTSSVAVPFINGQAGWVRATVNLDNGSGNSVCTFYTSTDGITWTQLGAIVTGGVVSGIFPATGQALEVGSNNSGLNTDAGRYYYAELCNGINGPVVASFDASQWNEPFRYYSPVANLLDKDTSDLEGSLGQWRVDSSGGSATGSVVRVAGVGVGGSAGAQGTVATIGTGTFFLAFAGNGAAGIPVLGGQTVSAMATAIAPIGGGRVIGLSANFFDMSGAYITTLAFQATVPTTGAPQVLSGAVVAPANAAYFFPRVALGAAIVGDVLTVDSGAAFYGALQAWSVGGVPWTASRTTSGRKLAFVDRSVLLFGTDDYLEALDHDDFDVAPGDSLSVVAVYRTYDSTVYQVVMSKYASVAGEGGWELAHSNGSPNVGGGFIDSGGANVSVYSPSNSLSLGVAVLQSLVRNVITDQIQTFLGTSPSNIGDTTTATFVNGQPVRIGRRTGTGGNYNDMELVAAVVFRRALSAAEIQQVQNELVRVGV